MEEQTCGGKTLIREFEDQKGGKDCWRESAKQTFTCEDGWFVTRAGMNNDLNVMAGFPLIQEIVCGAFEFAKEHIYRIHDKAVTRKRL